MFYIQIRNNMKLNHCKNCLKASTEIPVIQAQERLQRSQQLYDATILQVRLYEKLPLDNIEEYG